MRWVRRIGHVVHRRGSTERQEAQAGTSSREKIRNSVVDVGDRKIDCDVGSRVEHI